MFTIFLLIALNTILLIAIVMFSFQVCANLIPGHTADKKSRKNLHTAIAVFYLAGFSLILSSMALLDIEVKSSTSQPRSATIKIYREQRPSPDPSGQRAANLVKIDALANAEYVR